MTEKLFPGIEPWARGILLDPDELRKVYAGRTIRQLAREYLDVSSCTVRRALIHHGIPVRDKGSNVGTRKSIMLLANHEKALKSGDCPPNCLGKDNCLDGDEPWEVPCKLEEIVENLRLNVRRV